MSRKVRCLVVKVGEEPELLELDPREIGRAVGGPVEMMVLEFGHAGRRVVAFVHDDAIGLKLRPNRIVPTAQPYLVVGRPDGTRHVPVCGDFVVVATTRAGNEASLSDSEVAEWATLLQHPWRAPAKAGP